MLQVLSTRNITVAVPHVKSCPFCGAIPTWHEVSAEWANDWRPHFQHPGVITDKDCYLSGMGGGLEDVDGWNRRVTS
jgi:hypothetical protein